MEFCRPKDITDMVKVIFRDGKSIHAKICTMRGCS